MEILIFFLCQLLWTLKFTIYCCQSCYKLCLLESKLENVFHNIMNYSLNFLGSSLKFIFITNYVNPLSKRY